MRQVINKVIDLGKRYNYPFTSTTQILNLHVIPEAQCISEIYLEQKEAMVHSGNVKIHEEVLFCLAHSSRVVEKD